MKIWLALFVLPTLVYAQDPFQLTEEELNPETEEILLKKPEKHLRHESMIYDFNTDLGIKDQRQFTGADRNRFSVAGHVAGDYEHFNEMLGFDLSYMRRSTRYNQIWYGLQFFQQKTYFDAITQNHDAASSSDPNSEAAIQRPADVKNNVFAGGLGVGYRFKLLLDFFETENMFENIDVFANFVTLDETYIDRKYSGWGLTTNYGLHKRSGSSFFYGGKISYNIASVTREAIANESKQERSLTLGWLSLALEMGFFY